MVQPELTIPDSAAGLRPDLITLVALVAFRESALPDTSPGVQLSARYTAELFRRTDPKSGLELLNRATTNRKDIPGPLIVISKESKGIDGRFYRLGPGSTPEQKSWVILGEEMFGNDGILNGLFARPSFAYRGIGVLGSIVIGFVRRFGPVTEGEILQGVFPLATKQNVKKHIAELADFGLLQLDDGAYVTSSDIEEQLIAYENSSGLTLRASSNEIQFGRQQAVFHEFVTGSSYLKSLKDSIRRLPCIYCGKPAHPGLMTIEHFPPKHWGGTDNTSLILPSCRRHNSQLGRMIRGSDSLPTPTVTTIDLVTPIRPEEAEKLVVEVMIMRHAHMTRLILEGEISEARAMVADFFPGWVSYRAKQMRMIDSDSGEISFLEMVDVYPRLEEFIADYRGILTMHIADLLTE